MTDATSHMDPATLWAPRRQLTLEDARRRTVRVRFMRIFFLIGAATMLGLLMGYILQSTLENRARPVSIQAAEIVSMINPRFTGRDSAGLGFAITADEARRRQLGDPAVDLIAPVMTDSNGSEVRAPTGMYDREAGILELYEGVTISDKAGYTFVTDSARIYVDDGRVEGLSPLVGKGPLGDIRADTYLILEDGNRIVFEKNATMVLYPGKEKSGNEGETEDDQTP